MFTLYNENIHSYSELDASTRKQGGKLIQVSYPNDSKNPQPALRIGGQFLHSAGLDIGETVIACYCYGSIRAHRLPPASKVIYVKIVKYKYTDKPILGIRLAGEWLLEFGFAPNSLISSTSVPGYIYFKLHDDNDVENYMELVNYSRKNKASLLKVCESSYQAKPSPYIKTAGSCLDKAGFAIDDVLLASCGHGLITLQKLDFNQLSL